jgi:transposase
MARAYSADLRERVLAACERGDSSQAAVARRFEVSPAVVSHWRRAAREEGRRTAKPARGGRPRLDGALSALDALAAAHHDATLSEYADELARQVGRHYSLSAICRALQQLGWRRKKSPFTLPSRSAPTSPPRGTRGASIWRRSIRPI